MPSFVGACTCDRLCRQRRRMAVPRGRRRWVLPSRRLRLAASANPGQGPGFAPEPWPTVAAVVPARNEAESLPETLPSLLAQDYPGDFRVFVVDDNSDDGTGAIAAELGEKAARDGGVPLTVVKGQPSPDGWAGKVWAMAQGLAAATGEADAGRPGAGEATAGGPAPDYVLFTDADIAWSPPALGDLVGAAQADNRALVSQMALLRAETRWERVIGAAFGLFFAQLYPFRRVNDPKSGTAASADRLIDDV